MEFTTLVHIILGSTLTLLLAITSYFLVRMLFFFGNNKAEYTTKLRKFGLASIIVFGIYMLWIFIKKAFLLE